MNMGDLIDDKAVENFLMELHMCGSYDDVQAEDLPAEFQALLMAHKMHYSYEPSAEDGGKSQLRCGYVVTSDPERELAALFSLFVDLSLDYAKGEASLRNMLGHQLDELKMEDGFDKADEMLVEQFSKRYGKELAEELDMELPDASVYLTALGRLKAVEREDGGGFMFDYTEGRNITVHELMFVVAATLYEANMVLARFDDWWRHKDETPDERAEGLLKAMCGTWGDLMDVDDLDDED